MSTPKKAFAGGLAALTLASLACAADRRGIPPEEWTPKERELVIEMRGYYQRDGEAFTDEQAALFIKAMREKYARMIAEPPAR